VLENVRALEAVGRERLDALAARHPQIGEVRAVGAFQAIELVRDRATKERDRELQDATWAEAIRRGVFTDSSSTSLNIQPSLLMEPAAFGAVLDEVEKADPEVLNLFYQVFDKGMLSDGEGRLIDFKNTIVVLTSNLATDMLTELGTREERPSVEELVEAIRPTLSAHFKPALLARMQIIPFYPLIGAPLEKIVRLKLNKVGKRLRESQKMEFTYDDAVVTAIAARCTEVETGARNIDHIVNRTVLPEMATELLSTMGGGGEAPAGIRVTVDGDGRFAYQLN